MTYLSGKDRKKKSPVQYFFIIGFFVVIIFFWLILKSFLYPFVEPVVIYYASTKESFSKVSLFFETYTTSRNSLTQKNKELNSYVEQLENDLAQKNAKIKEITGAFSETLDKEENLPIVAYPLASDMTSLYSTVLLSRGYKDGIEKDMYVYVKGMKPVCLIKEVYPSTSLCELISKSGVVTEGIIDSTSSSTAITLTLVGRGGGAFLADVVRGTPILIGDTIFLKSNQSMALGTVVDIIHNNQDTSWRVFVKGAYNPSTSAVFYIHKK